MDVRTTEDGRKNNRRWTQEQQKVDVRTTEDGHKNNRRWT